MNPVLRVAWRLALVATLLAVPPVTPAEEAPCDLGSPNLSDNPHLDPSIHGGDSGSPWPVSIREARRRRLPTQSDPSAPATGSWPVPILAPFPGTVPRLLWLPLPGSGTDPAGLAAALPPG